MMCLWIFNPEKTSHEDLRYPSQRGDHLFFTQRQTHVARSKMWSECHPVYLFWKKTQKRKLLYLFGKVLNKKNTVGSIAGCPTLILRACENSFFPKTNAMVFPPGDKKSHTSQFLSWKKTRRNFPVFPKKPLRQHQEHRSLLQKTPFDDGFFQETSPVVLVMTNLNQSLLKEIEVTVKIVCLLYLGKTRNKMH